MEKTTENIAIFGLRENIAQNEYRREIALDVQKIFLKSFLLTSVALLLVGVFSMRSSLGVDLSADFLQESLDWFSQLIE